MRMVVSAAILLCVAHGAAKAQSGVTLYGVVDAPIEFVNRIAQGAPTLADGKLTFQPSGGSRLSMPSSGGLAGNRWGIRGKEELGGGATALFVLENGFALDSGSSQLGRLFGRQAFAGIAKENIGQLTFGRQYSSMFVALANFVPLRFAPLYEPAGALLGGTARADNSVNYRGNFGPLSAMAHYSFGVGAASVGPVPLFNGGAGEVPGHAGSNAAWGGGLNYERGGLGLSLAYDEWNPSTTVGQEGKSRKASMAVSYNTGAVNVMGGYRWGRATYHNGNTLARDDFWWAGGIYQVNPALGLTLAFYYWDIKSARLAATAASANPVNPWQISFRSAYALSKRTVVYLTTAYARNAGLNFDTSLTGFSSGYFPTSGQNDMLGVTVGLRHTF
ncbi:porin [Cupriavidus sp. NPDC089707]|uniref:porin n=1 Tax=Cupriavidus sp. NPDC089707 TaxID=3363963 RepID=UPI003800F0DD